MDALDHIDNGNGFLESDFSDASTLHVCGMVNSYNYRICGADAGTHMA
jgi:hypothetical protein